MSKMNCRRAAIFLLLLGSALAFAAPSNQPAKPITYEGLLKALKIGGLSTGELIDQVNHRGVDFELTPESRERTQGRGRSARIDAGRSQS